MADDATGALEAGAILADRNVDAVVDLTSSQAPTGVARVLLLPTRHDDARMARQRVNEVLSPFFETAVESAPPALYWKTDSTLRGPIGACFDALLKLLPRRMLVYVPAYPEMGRTVREGVLFVNGIPVEQTAFASDPRSPVRRSNVREAIAEHCGFPVYLAASAGELGERLNEEAPGVIVCDADTGEQVGDLIAVCRDAAPAPIVAGPAGGIRSWAGGPGCPTRKRALMPPVERWLLICGSKHPVSHDYCEEARGLGLEVWSMPRGALSQADEKLTAMAQRAAAHPADGMMIFGGDTALAVWSAMGVRRLQPLGELLPGVAVSQAAGKIFVSKAGGFVAPGLLAALQEKRKQ